MTSIKSSVIDNPKAPAKPPAPRKSRGGRPTKQEALALEQKILDVASRRFAEYGFAATTIEQIASDCSAGKGTIYRRYSSKVKLFEALMVRGHQDILPDLEVIASGSGAPLVILRTFARALLSINLRPELIALNRIALGEAVAVGGAQRIPSKNDPIMHRFSTLVHAAQTDGALAQGDPLVLAEQLLYATSIKPLLLSMLGSTDFQKKSQQDSYFEMAWNLFLNGAAGAATSETCA